MYLSAAAASQRGLEIKLASLVELTKRFEKEGLMDVITAEKFKRACDIEKLAGTQQSLGALRGRIRGALIFLSSETYKGKELDSKAGLIEGLFIGQKVT